MGSDESHFHVSLIVRDKVTQDSVHNPPFFSLNPPFFLSSFFVLEEKGQPERNRTQALLLTSLTPYS